MYRIAFTLASLLVLAACSDQPVAPAATAAGPLMNVNQGNGVVHRVSVGGPDICFAYGVHPGCDGNLSLIALQMADGSVQGQWEDASHCCGNLHAQPDCIEIAQPVPPFVDAWIGGVVTGPGTDPLIGHRVIIHVRDKGTSANDPADRISFSLPDPELRGISSNCHDRPLIGWSDVPQGQVKIE